MIIAKKFIGFATCWTRPKWKFWIRIYACYIEKDDGNRDVWVVCDDCKCPCDNFKIWFDWYEIRKKLGFPLPDRNDWIRKRVNFGGKSWTFHL